MQTITPYLLYKDVAAALEFLAAAFGFREVLRYTGEEGYVNHAEMQVGDGKIYLGDPGEQYRSPADLGQETVGIYVLVDDVDAHHDRAKAEGATIVEELVDLPFGHRRYTCDDPQGHEWSFASVVAG